MNIVFRTDASINIGTGHVMRCLTLADELRQKGTDINFICREEPGNMISHIGNRGYKVHQLPGEIDIETDRRLTNEILSNYESNPDWLIIDHYGIDISWEHPLRKYAKRLMVIDDLANREHDCDLLLDQNYSNNEGRYNGLVPENCIQLLGTEYAILRPQFQKARECLRKRDGGVNRILVFMGGVDSKNITSKILRAIHMLDRSDIAIDVVIGNLNPYHDEIKILTSKIPNISCHHNVENMAELILTADLCIGAGGTATWERCCVGLPTISIILAKNQENISEILDKEGAIINLGWHQNVNENNITECINELINYPRKIQSMTDIARSLVDGEGVKRVCNTIISMVSNKNQYKLILEEELDDKLVYKEDELITDDVSEIKPQVQTGGKDCDSVIRLSHPRYLLSGKDGTHQSESLMGNIIYFTKIKITDINDIFEWRNHPDIRKNFFNKGLLSWDEHEKWFMAKLKDPNSTAYMAYCRNERIGSIRFEANDNVIKTSVMLKPFFQGKGLGSKVIKFGVERFIMEKNPDMQIIAEVKKNNVASIKAFQKAGFRESHVTCLYDFKVLPNE